MVNDPRMEREMRNSAYSCSVQDGQIHRVGWSGNVEALQTRQNSKIG
jgi:hypothetical protein